MPSKYYNIFIIRAITSMQEQLKLIINMNKKLCDLICYCSMIGKLNHLIHTYFDISTIVGICSKFLQRLQKLYIKVSKQITRFI